ncbi:motile sperm domain-containing protein 2-like protein [Leptotrombidium deliense]|uniref:Motile sperm domain-containing protein 2-like protein n=1 Tax=Leptotrombidium deliense TaxID=299467 RepID=A0A443SK89_9ACAR|nr:motile sperm domain-containing protein 2-like protein [Leptotrombidium deliense]
MKKYLAYCINIIDQQAWGEGWVLIVDFGGIGMQNVDFELTKFLVHSLKTYFPSGIAYAMCVDFPWVLRAFLNAIKGLIPANRRHLVKFTSRTETSNYIDNALLPDFMGGHCKQAYKGWDVVPYGCPQFADFCRFQLGLPPKSCQKAINIYLPMIE